MGSSEDISVYKGSVLVTPEDDADPREPFRGLSMSAAAEFTYIGSDGQEYDVPAGHLSPGVIHPIYFMSITETGTTEDVTFLGWI